MSGLAISEAPPANVPLRFLIASVLWGIVAGGWIAWHGDTGLASRWTPATVVLVHLLALGVIGNAMLGALTQFLPVAARSRLRCAPAVPVLHGGFNVGLAVFAFAMTTMATSLLPLAAALLGVPLVGFAGMACLALWRGAGARWLRGGIGMSMCALAVTAMLGVVALLTLAGRLPFDLAALVDVHASVGTVGAVLVLIAAIGAVTLPMLQGTRSPAPWWFPVWSCVVASGLIAGAWQRARGFGDVLIGTITLTTGALAGASLWLQARARLRRNPTLARFWTLGMSALLAAAACLTLPLPPDIDRAMLVGTLALAIGFPFVVVGMMLEIVGFLAWIHLRGMVPRGRQVPGIGRLMPEGDKRVVFAAHVVSAVAVLLAMTLHEGHAAAGFAYASAWFATAMALVRCGLRVRRERKTPESAPA